MSVPAASVDLPIEYDPRLVEEALLRAIRGHKREQDFWHEREQVYELEDLDVRDTAFDRLHSTWFGRLALQAPLLEALREQPRIGQETRLCRVVRATARRDEGADLHVQVAEPLAEERQRRAVMIRLRPTSFLNPHALRSLLRHELMHISDMLNPEFGYELTPIQADQPSSEKLIRNRYRALWNATVDGRLLRKGWAEPGVRGRRLAEFESVFPFPAADAERMLARWFDAPDRTHAELLAFARKPSPGSDRCPLCRAPAFDLNRRSPILEPEVVEAIRRDSPQWHPSTSVCQQCADLYASRSDA